MNTRPYRPYSGRRKSPWLTVLVAVVLAGLVCFAALEGVVAAMSRDHIQGSPKAMVILGAQLKNDGPSLFLRRRLERALEYLDDHPDTVVVVSGGQGSDEPATEASAMEDFLRAHGFEGIILREEQSHNTRWNLKNSKALLAENGVDVKDGVVLVSNGFHLARVRLLAWRFGYNASTLAARSDHLGARIYGYLREPVGLVKSFLLDW